MCGRRVGCEQDTADQVSRMRRKMRDYEIDMEVANRMASQQQQRTVEEKQHMDLEAERDRQRFVGEGTAAGS